MARIAFVLAVLSVGLFGSAGAAIYLVKPDGTGDFPTIQAAVDASVGEEIVELSGGLFVGTGNRDITFLDKSLIVRSVGGDPGACVIDCEGTASDPHRAFVLGETENTNLELFGITITNGYTSGAGGAVYAMENNMLTASDCRFENNHAVGSGGAVTCGYRSSFTDCVFDGNSSEHRAGAVFAWVDHTRGFPTGTYFIRCMFYENSAPFAGAIAGWATSPQMEWCTFARNSAESAGICAGHWSTPHFVSCTVVGNRCPGEALIASDLVYVSSSLIAFNDASNLYTCEYETEISIACSDIFANTWGDWAGCLDVYFDGTGNIHADPQFCSLEPGTDMDWGLQADSPCSPDSSGCGLMGAWAVDCGVVETRMPSWGGIKNLFRLGTD